MNGKRARFVAYLGSITLAISSWLTAPSVADDRAMDSTVMGTGIAAMPFAVTSQSFSDGAEIPAKFSCKGADVSPELHWTDPPSGTQSFALIADDPDATAGTWTHWVLFDLPAEIRSVPEGVQKVDEVPTGGRQGRNDFRKIGYGGPCPPVGKSHRYFFKLYALDAKLNLKPGTDKQEVERAMHGHVLGETQLMGTFRR